MAPALLSSLRGRISLPPATRRPGIALALAASVAAAALAMGGRWLLQPWLDGNLVFVFAVPAVLAMALWAGLVPALATTVLCAAASLLLFQAPSTPAVLQATLFLVSSAVVAVFTALVSDNLRQHAAQVASPDDDAGAGDAATLLWLRIGVVLSVLVPWAVFAGVALVSHGSAFDAAQHRLERITGIAHEHALKLFQTTDLLVRQVNQQTQQLSPAELRRDEVRLSAQLAELTRGLAQVQSVWIVDADGDSLVSSRSAPLPRPGANASGRPAFVSHRQTGGQVIVVPPRVGSYSREVFFHLSRRRETADGRFNGITLVGLHPGYFTSFYRELADSEPGVVITLLHADGRLMARWPDPATQPAAVAADSPVLRGERGTLRTASSTDGVMRMGAWRRIGDYPIVAFARMDETTALAGWRREMLALAAFILPLSIGLALICHQALRRTRQHMDATAALRIEGRERQRVEAALRQSQKLEAMGHLTGGVAHDFNNLLMVVNLNVTLLRQRLRDAGHDRQLDAIERSVAAGKKLTRQLLAFSRRQPLLPRVIDLAELMPSFLDLIRPALGSRIELDGSVAPGTPRVRLDGGELELALINLAVNARDAMPEGGRVHIRVAADGDSVQLAFADTGVGIDPHDLERVFEPFFTTKPVGAGTGLGLAQVYGLCARAGGSARVESTPGVGTTVLLRFPAVEAQADPDATIPPLARAPIERLALRVLLVEDNPDVATATREVLQAAACEVVHVPAPDAALHWLARDARFDVVLSDIVMPGGMDGLQLGARLRRDHPGLPVVLMTGYAEKLGDAEAQGLLVLPKPFDPALLLRTLREQLRIADGQDMLQA